MDVAVEEVEAVAVEEQGPDDSPPRPSSGSPKWQELPLKVAFYSTTGRVIFQMPALTLGHISNVNIVLRTLATFYKDGLPIQIVSKSTSIGNDEANLILQSSQSRERV